MARHRRRQVPRPEIRVVTDPAESARQAGLRYVSDASPGTRRLRRGRGFLYLTAEGKPLRSATELGRIRRLAVPPAWRDVWICPSAMGHLQASGRDARGRKQYRYHPRWRETRDETKYNRMGLFGEALPRLRARVEDDLRRPGLPREKVLATVVRLLETTMIRVGNDEYARANGSFGLTTMRDRHVDVDGAKVSFEFRGKGGRAHTVEVDDRRLARIVERCQDLPGQELFQYVDEAGECHAIDSADVNAYIREISGEDFTAKDFRTWAGTVLAALALQEFASFRSARHAKRNITTAITAVARVLGNTPAICRKCYVHPAVIDAYLEGLTLSALKERAEQTLVASVHRLRPEEAAVLGLLQQRLAREEEADRRKIA